MRCSISLRESPRQYAPASLVSLNAPPRRPVEGMCGPRHRSTNPTLPVDGDLLAFGNSGDDFRLVDLSLVLEEVHRDGTVPDLPNDRLVALHDVAHSPFDALQILRSKGFIAGEVVVESILDGRADGHLRFRVEFLHRFGHDMGRVMAQDLQSVRR